MSTPRKFLCLRRTAQRHPNTPGHEISLGDISSPIILILRGFPRIFVGEKADSNHAWTEWRRGRDSNPR
jgi:hypothetical protein